MSLKALGMCLLKPFCWSLIQVDYGNAGSSKLYVFVTEVRYVGDGGQILADELSQDACTSAVEYSYAGHSTSMASSMK